MGEFLAHFDDSDSEAGNSVEPSMLIVKPSDRRESTFPKQEVPKSRNLLLSENKTDHAIQVHHLRKNKVFETVTKDLESRMRKERDEPRKRVDYIKPIHLFNF